MLYRNLRRQSNKNFPDMGQICSICLKEEPQQATAFADTVSLSDIHDSHHSQTPCYSFNGQQQQQTPNASSPALDFNNQSVNLLDSVSAYEEIDQIEEDRQRRMSQYRLEQAELARREAIVTAASQSMVPVGSQGTVSMGAGHRILDHHSHRGGGINTYYDPSYAAAAAQDILRSAAITGGLVFCDDQATKSAWNVSVIGTWPRRSSSPDRGSLSNLKDIIDSLGRGRWDGVRLGSRGSGLAGCGGEDPEYYLDDLAEAFLEAMVPTKTSLFGGCASIVENLP